MAYLSLHAPLLDDRCRRTPEPAVLSYRSEAFAEDLPDVSPPLPVAPRVMLTLTPVLLALAGAALSLTGLA